MVLRSRPSIFLTTAALLVLHTPTTTPSDSPGTLDGTAWVLAALPGVTLPAGRAVTLRFEGGRVHGHDGCNRFVGPYVLSGASLAFPAPGARTKMACPPETERLAAAFSAALGGTKGYRIEKERLDLLGTEGVVLATLDRQSTDLAGTAWEATGINNGKQAVASLVEDSRVTLEFAADGTASGTAGCNRFTTPYTADGSKLTFKPAAATRRMCARPELMRQEQDFLRALESVASARVDGDRLELRTATGALAVGLSRAPRP